MNMDGPRDEWTATDVWAESDSSTPLDGEEADESMTVDAVEYENRIRAVLNGSRTPREDSEDGDEEGIGVQPMLEKADVGGEVEIGIGEEEFGMQSPRSSAPSTPSQMPRQVSYIREYWHPSSRRRLRTDGFRPFNLEITVTRSSTFLGHTSTALPVPQ